MVDRPIIFSAPMVRALLDGRKTQTRRILKPQLVCFDHSPWPDSPDTVPSIDDDGVHCAICGAGMALSRSSKSGVRGIPVRFSPGDRLFVRENHRLTDCTCTEACRGPGHVWYEADSSGYWNVSRNKLRPSIHMPRWASRLTLAVTRVKVERLNDISLDDVAAEGCKPLKSEWAILWDNINGEGAYTQNPFVIAITFRVIKANIDAPEALAA